MALADELVRVKAIFTSLMAALDLSDPYTRGHSDRVGSLATALGIELGLETRELEILQDASVLHDIGKIGVPKEVLNKPGPLTPEEFEEMKNHVRYGHTILSPLSIPELSDITLFHHERVDGKGYLEGRTDYPILVRVLQIADVWDALTSDRPYRPAMSFAEARKLMNTQENRFGFDAEILETFHRLTRYLYPDADVDPDEIEHIMDEIRELDVAMELALSHKE
jgi:HD-GYP domain-containing protein (c-di-GMP phosphodiesterase class II)